MTHIKCKFDMPYCLVGHQVKFTGEFCSHGCGCKYLKGKEICNYFRFSHREIEKDVIEYEFKEAPGEDPGLMVDGNHIPIDLISFLQIDGKVLVDYEELVGGMV